MKKDWLNEEDLAMRKVPLPVCSCDSDKWYFFEGYNGAIFAKCRGCRHNLVWNGSEWKDTGVIG